MSWARNKGRNRRGTPEERAAVEAQYKEAVGDLQRTAYWNLRSTTGAVCVGLGIIVWSRSSFPTSAVEPATITHSPERALMSDEILDIARGNVRLADGVRERLRLLLKHENEKIREMARDALDGASLRQMAASRVYAPMRWALKSESSGRSISK
ncbi:hypothetical protein Axi01nite_93920 [Actinoplanes xinjiangensis]|nr:hypothetical protein Axi01nite_93920 [Actinoplanes xinjiangensis]